MTPPTPRKSSLVNASELRATFTDYDTRESPYEGRALSLHLSADVAFVYVGKLTDERGIERFEFTDEHSVGVDAELLYQTLGAMLRRADREAHDRLREGTLPADHPSLAVAHEVVPTPATRRRA